MKKIVLPSVAAMSVILFTAFSIQQRQSYETLKVGAEAPMEKYEMQATDGSKKSLSSLSGENGLLVIFSCNTCPFVIKWEDRYPELNKLTKESGMGFVLVNSNQAKRNGDDSMDKMIAHAKEKGYADIPYVVDENSKLANAFGAKTTPHVFLFDKKMKLVYEGAIDDNFKDASSVSNPYLRNAIHNLLSNKKIDPNNTKSVGCSIKRAS